MQALTNAIKDLNTAQAAFKKTLKAIKKFDNNYQLALSAISQANIRPKDAKNQKLQDAYLEALKAADNLYDKLNFVGLKSTLNIAYADLERDKKNLLASQKEVADINKKLELAKKRLNSFLDSVVRPAGNKVPKQYRPFTV